MFQVEDFFTMYPNAGAGSRGREQALESIKRNIAWMDRYQDGVTQWLRQQTSSMA